MPRRIVLIIIFALLTLAAAPTHADDAPGWTAWLHYGPHMTLIDSNGHSLREVDLPAPEGYKPNVYRLLPQIGVSREGRFFAYVFEFGARAYVTIFDTQLNEVKTTYQPNALDAYDISAPNNWMFNGTSTAVAFVYSEGDDLADNLQIRIEILNIDGGTISYRLNTATQALGLPAHWVMTPYLEQYSDNEVTFALKLVEPYPENPDIWLSLAANVLTGVIQSDIAFANLPADILVSTGEIVTPSNHLAFPTIFDTNPEMPWQTFPNVLQVYDPITSESYPFFWMIGVIPERGIFVQNGERILMESFRKDSLPRLWELPEKQPEILHTWTLLERDGTIVDQWTLPKNFKMEDIENASDGFLYTVSVKTPDVYRPIALPTVYEVNTRDDKLDTGRLVWQIPMKEFHSYFDSSEQPYFDIAWIHSDAPVGPFKPWAQLADPVYAPTPQPSTATITPTTIPTPPPLFHVGQTVRVQTIDGEILNLRAEPTRKSEILVYIEDDTQLELLEGPVEAEGFHWWRVHTPDDLEGWVVENDGELQTILPE